jgi:hypothetical protein
MYPQMFLYRYLKQSLLENHAKITKAILIAAVLLLTVALSLSQLGGSVLAQQVSASCTQSGTLITCSGTVSGLTQGVFKGSPGQCPTGHGQDPQAKCVTLAVEETGVVVVSVPVAVTSSCNNPHGGPVPPFTATTTTTLTGNSDPVSGGFIVKNPGGQITTAVPGTSTLSIEIDASSISTQLPQCPPGLTPTVDITANVAGTTFTFEQT